MLIFYVIDHPGVEATDLVHEVHEVRVGERKEYPGSVHGVLPKDRARPRTLCHNCGLNTDHMCYDYGYTSRLKVFYLKENSAIWELGPNGGWMLRDEPNNPGNKWANDYITQQFIRKKLPNFPLVEMHRFGGPDDKFHFTIMSRAKGSSVRKIWDTLTEEQKQDVVRDLKGWIKELRQITSPYLQRVDGSESRDCFIGTCNGLGCIKTGRTDEEWIKNLIPGIRREYLHDFWHKKGGRDASQEKRASFLKEVDEEIAQLMAKFPRSGPYVLTHSDLNLDNIFISDDNEEGKFKVSAFIDWELAGFFPWWAEDYNAEVPDVFDIQGNGSDMYYPGYSIEDSLEAIQFVWKLRKMWRESRSQAIHKPHIANSWYRPPYCVCAPYCREIRENTLGLEEEHLDMYDVDSTESDESESEALKRSSKSQRDFLRWFNEVSGYKSKRTGLNVNSPP